MNLKKIKSKVRSSKYIKYLLIFIIVFVITFGINFLLINDLQNKINEKQISYTDFYVVDKYVDENMSHDFIVISNNNQTYKIIDDKNGIDIFNRIEKGHRYHFVIRSDNDFSNPYIIQVYDERK